MASWPGVLDPTLLKEEVVARNHRLADAAKAGRWAEVFEVLDLSWVSVNQWRLGGTRGSRPSTRRPGTAPRHRSSHGLLERGALRSLPARDGRTPYDVAQARGHTHLLDLLTPRGHQAHSHAAADLDRGLASVIDGRLRLPEGIADSYGKPLEECLRYPPVAVLPECPEQRLWFAVPGCTAASPSPDEGELPLRRVVDPRRRRLRPGPRGDPRGRHPGRRGVRLDADVTVERAWVSAAPIGAPPGPTRTP